MCQNEPWGAIAAPTEVHSFEAMGWQATSSKVYMHIRMYAQNSKIWRRNAHPKHNTIIAVDLFRSLLKHWINDKPVVTMPLLICMIV